MKKIVLVLCLMVTGGTLVYGSDVSNILYQNVEKEPVASGVTYEKDTRLTAAGWLDVHTLEIDLKNPYVSLDVIRSTESFGKKEKLTNLAKQNRVVAAVNGDYFNMKKNPTDIQGFEYEKNKTLIGKHLFNSGHSSWASFMMNTEKTPDIDYVSMRLVLTSEEGKEIYVSSLNKYIGIKFPSYFDGTSMVNTEVFDKTNPDMCKLVVEDNVVLYQSEPGELVTVPENGFVIIMDEKTAVYSFKGFPVGTKIDKLIHTNVDMEKLELAISGGGKIISQGRVATDGEFYGKNQKAPRTSIGYNQTKDKLYMVVIDGRGSSIGVDQVDLAQILLQKGLYDAMHLDGGGSTTMVGRPLGMSEPQVLNKPSGGVQRKIPNGIGVLSSAPVRPLAHLRITADKTRVFQDMPMTFQVIGFDANYNPVAIDMKNIIWQTSGMNGRWEGSAFYPAVAGEGTIVASYEGITAQMKVKSMLEPISMEINQKHVFLEPGESISYKVMGIDKDGYRGEVNVKNVKWQIKNKTVGAFHDGKFVAEKEGISLITGTIGDTNVYGYMIVAKEQRLIDSFDMNTAIEAVVYPSTVAAETSVINGATEGNNFINLKYTFNEAADVTQAAYVKFQKPYVFDKSIHKIGMWVDGNGSGHWLRGKLVDAEGTTYKVTLAGEIDWTGWKYVTAKIPEDVVYPIELTRVYVASLRTPEAATWSLSFNDLTVHQRQDVSGLRLPTTSIFDPSYNKALSKPSITMAVFGSTGDKNRLLDYIVQRRVVEKMDEVADVSLFVGDTDLRGMDISNDQVIWKDTYAIKDYKDVRIIHLATSGKGMRKTNPEQWKKFVKDLYATKQKHVIMAMNKNPLKGFADKREGQLFHDILKKFKEETGKNLFVINGSGYDFKVDYMEGVTYMDINGLWYKVDDMNKVNLKDTFYMLNFAITADDITYKVMNAYPQIIIE